MSAVGAERRAEPRADARTRRRPRARAGRAAAAAPSARDASPPAAACSARRSRPRPPRATGGPDTEVLRRRWPEVLETVKGLRRVTWALIDPRNAQVAELDATTLKVAFDNPALATTFRNGAHADVVARAVRETLGFDVRVEGILAEQARRPRLPPRRRPDPPPTSASNPRAVTPAEAAASWDDEPPMPEPPDDEPGEPAHVPDAPPHGRRHRRRPARPASAAWRRRASRRRA